MKNMYFLVIVLIVVEIVINVTRDRLSMDLNDPVYCSNLNKYLEKVNEYYYGSVDDYTCIFGICRYRIDIGNNKTMTVYSIGELNPKKRVIVLSTDDDEVYLYNIEILNNHIRQCKLKVTPYL